jgi:hypothetical protein
MKSATLPRLTSTSQSQNSLSHLDQLGTAYTQDYVEYRNLVLHADISTYENLDVLTRTYLDETKDKVAIVFMIFFALITISGALPKMGLYPDFLPDFALYGFSAGTGALIFFLIVNNWNRKKPFQELHFTSADIEKLNKYPEYGIQLSSSKKIEWMKPNFTLLDCAFIFKWITQGLSVGDDHVEVMVDAFINDWIEETRSTFFYLKILNFNACKAENVAVLEFSNKNTQISANWDKEPTEIVSKSLSKFNWEFLAQPATSDQEQSKQAANQKAIVVSVRNSFIKALRELP